MSNAERIAPRESFPDGFITDTYSNVRDADGYDEVIPVSVNEVVGDGLSFVAGASAGSVTTQYAALYWSMHEDDFWGRWCDDE